METPGRLFDSSYLDCPDKVEQLSPQAPGDHRIACPQLLGGLMIEVEPASSPLFASFPE